MNKQINCIREDNGTIKIETDTWKLVLKPLPTSNKDSKFSFQYFENDNSVDVGDILVKSDYKAVIFAEQRMPFCNELTKILERLIDCLPILRLLKN